MDQRTACVAVPSPATGISVEPLQEISSSDAQRTLTMRTNNRVIIVARYLSVRQLARAFFRQVAACSALLCGWLFLLLLTAPTPALAAHELILHGGRNRPLVALTFDICQTPGRPTRLDRAVIDRLRAYQVPATLFLGGDWMRTHPDETRALAAEPLFELANHSWSHPDLRLRTPAQISEEVQRTDDELFRLTGRRSRLFRLPFGYYDPATLATLADLQLNVIQWDVVSADPDKKMTAAKLQHTLRNGLKNGSIVVMHANGRGWHTAEALPGIIAFLRARGLQPVTVSQLLSASQPECRVPLVPGRCLPVSLRWPDPALLRLSFGEAAGFASR